jgi:hypothetical protein
MRLIDKSVWHGSQFILSTAKKIFPNAQAVCRNASSGGEAAVSVEKIRPVRTTSDSVPRAIASVAFEKDLLMEPRSRPLAVLTMRRKSKKFHPREPIRRNPADITYRRNYG